MKNGDVITAYETLNRLSENRDLKFEIAVGYLLAKNKEKLRQEASLIYKMRQDIILEHGQLEGKNIVVPSEYIDETNEKIEELMNIENDIKLTQIPIDMLEHYELNMEDIEGLSNIIMPFKFTSPPILEEKTDG